MLKIQKKEGLASILEAFFTAIIFILAFWGISTTVGLLRLDGSQSVDKLRAAYVAQQVVQDLRAQISAETWNNTTGSLAPDIAYTLDYGNYLVNYYLTDVGTDLRKLDIQVYKQ